MGVTLAPNSFPCKAMKICGAGTSPNAAVHGSAVGMHQGKDVLSIHTKALNLPSKTTLSDLAKSAVPFSS